MSAGVIVFALLYVAIGGYGIAEFFSFTIVSMIANTFFFMTIINTIVKGYENVNHEETFVMITIGFMFEVLYVLLSHKTVYGMMIDTLKSLVVIFIVSSIVSYMRREVKKI